MRVAESAFMLERHARSPPSTREELAPGFLVQLHWYQTDFIRPLYPGDRGTSSSLGLIYMPDLTLSSYPRWQQHTVKFLEYLIYNRMLLKNTLDKNTAS